MDVSIFLARVLGILAVISSLAIIFNYKKTLRFEIDLAKNLASVYASGFIFLILGVLILVGHPVFEASWRVVITIMGMAMLAKGIGRILFPESVRKMIEKKTNNHKFILGEVVFLLIGLYLSYYGFIVY